MEGSESRIARRLARGCALCHRCRVAGQLTDSGSEATAPADTQGDEGTKTPPSLDVESSEPQAAKSGINFWRIGLLVLFLGASFLIAWATGLTDYFTVERIQTFMDSAGAWGFLAFIVLFSLGELAHVPGIVFVGAASIAYGTELGMLAAYVGAVGSVTLSFVIVRSIGGQPLAAVQRPFIRRILSKLEKYPIRTIVVLRLIMWMAPQLNYALAMTKVRFRDYVLGSALGLVLPIPLAVLFFEQLRTWFL